jgi:uncharacterized protein with ParB-like and HNH nuclease domain
MNSIHELDVDLEGIGHALGDNYLAVPRYQRSYAWKEDNVADLFHDVAAAIAGNEPEYFLGSVVVSRRPDSKLDVVDGQQRLATITILLAVIRDYFIEVGDIQRADDVERDFLVTRERRSQELVPKFSLNLYDNEFFKRAILSRPKSKDRNVTPARESHERILSAQKLAAKQVRHLAATTKDSVSLFLDWIEYIEKRVKVIWVEVPDHANAFIIFETLNDRGLDLSIADLLKNYLFGKADNRIDEVQERWSSMLGALETVGGEEIVLTYIRHLWASLYGATREKVLYDSIKREINSKQNAFDFADQLSDGAKLYAALLNPRHELWNKYSPKAREHIETLMQLRLEQFRPLLIAVLSRFTPAEVTKTLHYLVSASVRFLVVGGLGGGTMERVYSETAVKVQKKDITGAKGVAASLAKFVPTDSEFRANFATARVSQSYLARYYLSALERKERGESQPSFVPNENYEDVNLEHVLPENPSNNWKPIDLELAKSFYNRLGNLALLHARTNSKIGNQSFTDKKDALRESEFKLTAIIGEQSRWGTKEIEERQVRLANLAVKTWPLRLH